MFSIFFVGQRINYRNFNSKRSHEPIFATSDFERERVHAEGVFPTNLDASLTQSKPGGAMRRAQSFHSIFGVPVLSRGSVCVRPHPKFRLDFSQSRERRNAWFDDATAADASHDVSRPHQP
ncbi:hypothetical protein B0H13DRAFT_2685037 [Mycena leptocephala]|nr:hypothetical protein B0H13DRAFT_2685037 [Mycena leptocephala]